MSCSCNANSLRLFIRSFSSLDLESCLTRSALRNPANRPFRTSRQRQFTIGATRNWSAKSDFTHADSASSDNPRPQGAASSGQSPLKKGALMDLADLTDESMEELLREPPSRPLPRDPEPEKKLSPRKTTDSRNTEASESSSAEPVRVNDEKLAQETRIHRSGARTDSSNRDLPWNRNQSQPLAKANYFSATKSTPSYPENDHLNRNKTASKEREPWQIHKEAIKEKLQGESWNPRKRLSPDALNGIRVLHAQFPDQFNTETLAAQFEVSPEAMRRILKSKWRASEDEEEDRKQRWFRRGEKVWERNAELGMKPPKRWRVAGVDRKYSKVPLWDRKRRSGASKGGGIIIKKGVKAGDVRNEWDIKGGGEDWV